MNRLQVVLFALSLLGCGESADYARTETVVGAVTGYACGGASQPFQDPNGGGYTFTMQMPDGPWSGTAGVFDTALGLSHLYLNRTSPAESVSCIARWNGISFQALCPAGQGPLTSELAIEGVQSNNGASATLTASTYLTLFGVPHAPYSTFSASGTGLTFNRQLTGNPIPCPNPSPPLMGTFHYSMQIETGVYGGTVTTNTQGGSYYEMVFSNPSTTLFPTWNGHAFAVFDTTTLWTIYVTTGVPATGPGSPGPWGAGGDTDPLWLFSGGGPYNYGPSSIQTGSDVTFF